MTTPLGRRTFLSGAGLGAAMLPLLRSGHARAASAFPKRFAVIVWPNGVLADQYWPRGGETDFMISDDLASPLRPLIPHRDDILLLGGLELRSLRDDEAPGGHAAFPYLLTGVKGQPVNAPINPDGWKKSAGAASLDQVIADEIAKTVKLPFHSLQLQAGNQGPAGGRFVSFRGAPTGGQPNAPTPEDDPIRLYEKLFAGPLGAGVGADQAQRLLAERRSVLDHVGRSLERMSKRLGSEDREKLEAHLTGVRQIELTLSGLVTPATCGKPAAPPSGKEYFDAASRDYPEILKVQLDLITAAFACDLTRVATTMWSSCHNNGVTFFWLGRDFYEGTRDSDTGGYSGPYRHHHEIAHNGHRSADHARRKNMVDQWFISQLAGFIERLRSVKEGDGTLLDNTVVLFANSMSNGAAHSVDDLPWILAGRAGGAIKTGRLLRWAGGEPGRNVPHNRLLVSLANALGLPVSSFGDTAYGGALPRMRG